MGPQSKEGNIEQLMAELRQGNREAAGARTALLWPELRRLAAAQMKGERSNHTWQPYGAGERTVP